MAFSYVHKIPEPAVLIEDGREVLAVVDSVEFGLSKQGNEMATMKVQAVDDDGKVLRTITEHLPFTEKAEWKLNQVIDSLGLARETGETLEIDEQLLTGQKGRVRIGVDSYTDTSGNLQKVNRIAAWLSSSGAAVAA